MFVLEKIKLIKPKSFFAVLSSKWLRSFSAEENLKTIFSVKKTHGEIRCLNGIRSLNLLMLIIGHKGMVINFTPMSNQVEMNAFLNSLISVPLRASFLNTDAFLMLSSLLLSYSMIGRLNRGRKINVLKEIASRYFRFMIPIAALILFATFIFPHIRSGPQWLSVIVYQSELCRKHWWRNFLMIQNWFGVENICIMHTHHIGTDFELFLVAIFLIIYLHRKPKVATVAILALAFASTAANFSVTLTERITHYALFGIE